MAKRFTDTDKWKKPFLRGLQAPYKLLWFYILDDCDHAGIWAVDFEVARIRIGEQLDKHEAINAFGDRIQILNGGTKWFIRDFVDFQYGELKETNRMHLSVINILAKNKIKPLTSPLQGAKDKDKDKDMVKDKEMEADWIFWSDQILKDEDQYWQAMKGRKVTEPEMKEFLSVATRCDWKMLTQQSFRTTLNGFKSNGTETKEKKIFKLR